MNTTLTSDKVATPYWPAALRSAQSTLQQIPIPPQSTYISDPGFSIVRWLSDTEVQLHFTPTKTYGNAGTAIRRPGNVPDEVWGLALDPAAQKQAVQIGNRLFSFNRIVA